MELYCMSQKYQKNIKPVKTQALVLKKKKGRRKIPSNHPSNGPCSLVKKSLQVALSFFPTHSFSLSLSLLPIISFHWGCTTPHLFVFKVSRVYTVCSFSFFGILCHFFFLHHFLLPLLSCSFFTPLQCPRSSELMVPWDFISLVSISPYFVCLGYFCYLPHPALSHSLSFSLSLLFHCCFSVPDWLDEQCCNVCLFNLWEIPSLSFSLSCFFSVGRDKGKCLPLCWNYYYYY